MKWVLKVILCVAFSASLLAAEEPVKKNVMTEPVIVIITALSVYVVGLASMYACFKYLGRHPIKLQPGAGHL